MGAVTATAACRRRSPCARCRVRRPHPRRTASGKSEARAVAICTYTTGDELGIRVEGDTVTYLHQGVAVHVSDQAQALERMKMLVVTGDEARSQESGMGGWGGGWQARGRLACAGTRRKPSPSHGLSLPQRTPASAIAPGSRLAAAAPPAPTTECQPRPPKVTMHRL